MGNLKLQKEQEIYRGSEWRKWDLHIHSDCSPESPEQIVDKLIEKGISVFSITDHSSVEDTDKFLEIVGKKQKENKKIYFLPGVELKTDKGKRSVHLIGIFPLKNKDGIQINSDFLKQNLLSKIDCSDTDIVDAGKKALGEGKSTREYRKRGLLEISVNFERAAQKIRELEGITIVHAGTKTSGLEKEMYHARTDNDQELYSSLGHTKRDLMEKYIHVCELTNWNKSSLKERDFYLKTFYKPSIVSSDSYNLSDIGKKYTWIKADTTFEGLKQIIYEPKLRIRIQEDNPQENETYTCIENCIVKFPTSLRIRTEESGKKTDFCLQGEYKLEFSNNLNCIIGGRGSGKSTFMHLLFNVWPQKEIARLREINSPLLSLDLTPDSLKKTAELTTIEIPSDTEFFLQNEIEKFARDIDEMSSLIRYRLMRLSSFSDQTSLKDLQNKWSTTSHSMERLIESYDHISEVSGDIKSLRGRIKTIKKQTTVMKSEEYKSFQKNIEDINDKISAFRRYKNEYARVLDEIDTLVSSLNQLQWNEEQGKDVLDNLIKSLQDYTVKLKVKFTSSKDNFEENKYTDQLATKKLQLRKYLEKKGLAAENIEELADASEQIRELEDKIKLLEVEKKPSEDIYSKRKEILEDYKKKYSAYHHRFFQVATQLEKELKDLPFFDKEISFTPKINEQLLQEAAVEFVKKNSSAKIILRSDDIQNVLFDVKSITEYILDKNKIQICVDKSKKTILHKQVLQELVNNSIFLEKLYLRLWKDYHNIDNIQVQTKLGEKLLQNTSFGERCGIVVSIVLVAGTNPIVIDQPEDNLDGKFISNVLVPLIRKRKYSRQVILVTRDANIVIGSDAELIHILEIDGKKTEIIPSSIENAEHREKYIWILDGGKKAFQKREQKYGFRAQ